MLRRIDFVKRMELVYVKHKMSENSSSFSNLPSPASNYSMKSLKDTDSPGKYKQMYEKSNEGVNTMKTSIEKLEQYKAKTIKYIEKKTQELEAQRKRISDTMIKLEQNHEIEMNKLKEAHEARIQALIHRPLFDNKELKEINQSITKLRFQQTQLRSQFILNMDQFKNTFNTCKNIFHQYTIEYIHSNSLEKIQEVKKEICALQKAISEKCISLSNNMIKLDIKQECKLNISEPLTTDVVETPKVQLRKSSSVSDCYHFAHWMLKNSLILSQ